MNKKKNKRLEKNKEKSRFLHPKIYILILTLAVLAIYAQTTKFDFINIDDGKLIYENPIVVDANVSYLKAFEQYIFEVHYKPLVFISWKLENDLLGSDPWHFHFFNWFLHAINTILLFFIGIKIFERFYDDKKKVLVSAFFLSLLFTINPLRVESVAWATERKDVLFSFFFLSAWLAYLNYIVNKNYRLILLGCLLYLFSGLSKSMGLTLIAVLFLTDLGFQRKMNLKLIWEKIPFFFVFLVLVLLYGIVPLDLPFEWANRDYLDAPGEQLQYASGDAINQLHPYIQYTLEASTKILFWIGHTLIPLKLTLFYPYDKIFLFLGKIVFILPFVVIGIFLFAWKNRKIWPALLLGLLFYLITLSPVLATKGAGHAVFLADRYTYIPAIGILFTLIYFLNKLKENKLTLFYLLIIGISFFYLTISFSYVKKWKDTLSILDHAIKIDPTCPFALNNRGFYYRKNNKIDQAFSDYNLCLQAYPTYYPALYNRGKAYSDMNQIDLAIEDMNKCLSIKPDFFDAQANRGALWGRKKNFDKALADLNEVLKNQPKHINALYNRGLIYFQLEKYENTITDYTAYLKEQPNNPDIENAIGLSHLRLDQHNKAITRFNRSIRLNPQNEVFYMNRSMTYNATGDKSKALADALKAQELGLKINPEYIANLRK